jgi:hypothetical protein
MRQTPCSWAPVRFVTLTRFERHVFAVTITEMTMRHAPHHMILKCHVTKGEEKTLEFSGWVYFLAVIVSPVTKADSGRDDRDKRPNQKTLESFLLL